MGLIFYEYKGLTDKSTSYESYLNLGFGAIYPVNDLLNAVGEITIRTEGDYMLLSGGADYKLGNGRVRGSLGIGPMLLT